MLYLMLALSTLTSAGKTVLLKKIGVDAKTTKQLFASNAMSFLFAALFTLVFSGFDFQGIFTISPFSFGMSALFALSVIFTYLAQTKAMSFGNASSTMLIYSTGFLVPILFGVVAYRERVSLIQLLALGILLAALVLIINPQRTKKPSLSWVILSFLAALGSGLIAVWQKIHQSSPQAEEFPSLLSWEFILAGASLYIITAFLPGKSETPALSRRIVWVAAVSGIFVSLLNMLNIQLAGKLPAVVVFPIYNIGSLILSGITCGILFRETIRPKETIGFILGCIAILLIGIF
ncbi:MAG: EamA family transporter [Clostridia bacterium]|nr:EamA family transporter [Clostridia bacterium]